MSKLKKMRSLPIMNLLKEPKAPTENYTMMSQKPNPHWVLEQCGNPSERAPLDAHHDNQNSQIVTLRIKRMEVLVAEQGFKFDHSIRESRQRLNDFSDQVSARNVECLNLSLKRRQSIKQLRRDIFHKFQQVKEESQVALSSLETQLNTSIDRLLEEYKALRRDNQDYQQFYQANANALKEAKIGANQLFTSTALRRREIEYEVEKSLETYRQAVREEGLQLSYLAKSLKKQIQQANKQISDKLKEQMLSREATKEQYLELIQSFELRFKGKGGARKQC